jgi:hypothetical protein
MRSAPRLGRCAEENGSNHERSLGILRTPPAQALSKRVPPPPSPARVTARLHPLWSGGGYLYSVDLGDELLIEGSRDPETDAARALLVRGITGKLTLLDGKTGKPRTIVNVEKAARLRVEEGPHGPHFRKCHESALDSAPRRFQRKEAGR